MPRPYKISPSLAALLVVVTALPILGFRPALAEQTARQRPTLPFILGDSTNLPLPRAGSLALAGDEEPPPMVMSDNEADERKVKAAEAKEKQKEIDDLPAYKRWWFWAAAAAVVGTAVIVGVAVAKPANNPPKACGGDSNLGCFGAGR